MKSLINFLILLPVLLFLIIIILNRDLLYINETISIFGITESTVPVIAFSSIFFAWYIIAIYLFFKFSNIFTSYKNKKLESEINKLKSKLYEERPKLVDDLKSEFSENLENYKLQQEKEVKIYKKENEKVVSSLEYEIKALKEKLDKINQK